MDKNLEIYSENATFYADKFNKFSRVGDIEQIFSLCKKDNPRVLDLGCANGRDAKEILKRTKNYIGVDGAEKLLDIAKKSNPQGHFILSDFRKLNLDKSDFDIIIDFDSLFHLDENDLKNMLENIYNWLDDGGLFLMDAKFGTHKKIVNHDQNDKIQYLYKPEDIIDLFGCKLELVFHKISHRIGKDWFTIILRKKTNE